MKIMENEKHPLDDLKNDASFMAVVFFILSIISARMLLMQIHPAWTLQFLFPAAMFAVCLLGMGVCGGVIVTSILHHKELM